MLHWCQKSRRRSSATTGRWWRRRPRGGRRAAARGRSLPGRSPTESTTTSAPRPPVIPLDRGDHVVGAVIERDAAPSRRANASLASDPLVAITRAPSSTPICRAAIPTPPPTPQTSTVSPARSPARPDSIRHAVSVAREKAAASGPRHLRRHRRHVRGRHHHQFRGGARAVLAQDREVGAERLLARQAGGAAAAGDAGVEHHPVARADAGDLGADRLHDPGAVGADDVGEADCARSGSPPVTKRSTRLSAAHADPHPYVVGRAQRGRRHLLQHEAVEPADLGQGQSLHALGRDALLRTTDSPPARPP